MINVKLKNKFFLILIGLFISISCEAKAKDYSCSTVGKNKICLFEYTDKYGENAYRLKIGNTDYYKISYYDNAKLKKINEESVEVSTNFSDRGNIDISTLILLKKNKPFLQRISSSSRINESSYGAIENCKVFIKTYFSKDINFYVDKYIFDLSDKEKSKICSKIKLTH